MIMKHEIKIDAAASGFTVFSTVAAAEAAATAAAASLLISCFIIVFHVSS